MTPDLLQIAMECNGAGLIVMQGKVKYISKRAGGGRWEIGDCNYFLPRYITLQRQRPLSINLMSLYFIVNCAINSFNEQLSSLIPN